MADLTITADAGHVIRVEHDYADVSSLDPRVPDPEWRHVDPAGHEHRWVDGATPSLVVVLDQSWWCRDCHEEHATEHLACRECLAPVDPGTVAGPPVQRLRLGARYYLDDVEVTPAALRPHLEAAGLHELARELAPGSR